MYERTGKGGEGGREERERHTHRQTEREARGARATGRARGDGGVSLLPAPPTSLMVPEDASCQPLFSAVVAAEQRVRRGETASRTSTRLSTLVIACTTDSFVKLVLSASLLCDGANLCHPKRAGRDPKKSSAKTAVEQCVLNGTCTRGQSFLRARPSGGHFTVDSNFIFCTLNYGHAYAQSIRN